MRRWALCWCLQVHVAWLRSFIPGVYCLHSPWPGWSRPSPWPGWCNRGHLAPSLLPPYTYQWLLDNWWQINWVMNARDARKDTCLKLTPTSLTESTPLLNPAACLASSPACSGSNIPCHPGPASDTLECCFREQINDRGEWWRGGGRSLQGGAGECFSVPTNLSDSWCSPRV